MLVKNKTSPNLRCELHAPIKDPKRTTKAADNRSLDFSTRIRIPETIRCLKPSEFFRRI